MSRRLGCVVAPAALVLAHARAVSAQAAEPSAVEVTVHGKKAEPPAASAMTETDVKQLPGAFGDPFRAIEVLPGVTPVASGVPYFFVRGAPPGNVGYFLDGIRVPLLYHIGLGPSVVHPALVERVELYPGGYPAEFGRFAGGIVAAETKPPSGIFHGAANLRLLDAGAVVEGPFAQGRAQALVGGRYSYTGLLLSAISPTTELSYWDYQSRVTYDLGPDERLGVFAFGSYDFTGEKKGDRTSTVFETQFHRLDLRFDKKTGGGGAVRVAATLGLDRTAFGEDGRVRDRSLAVRSRIAQPWGRRVTVRGGTDANLDAFDIEANKPQVGSINEGQLPVFLELLPTRRDLALGAYLELSYRPFDVLTVIPGIRADFFSSRGETAIGVDPRIATRITLGEGLDVFYAFGVAHQPPSYVVPIPGFQIAGLRGGLQSSVQSSAGVEWDITKTTRTKATLFENAFFQMTDPLGTLHFSSGDHTDFARRSGGRSIGVELMAQGQLGAGFSGFVTYTLSRSSRTLDGQTFLSAFDRTHTFQAAVGHDLGRKWRAGVRTALYSGLPDPRGGSDRLPGFYRFDLRLEKRWPLGDEGSWAFTFELMNATFQRETLNTRCDGGTCRPVTIGPITLPSVGLEAEF
jgi:hypothetical protein